MDELVVYTSGYAGPNKTPVLITLKVDPRTQNNFNKKVFDKNNAEYCVSFSTPIRIIDEMCNEYLSAVYVYRTVELNKEICMSISCYLTKSRALADYTSANEIYKYDSDGHVMEIQYKKESKIEKYYTNGVIAQSFTFKKYTYNKLGNCKFWYTDKTLLLDCQLADTIVTSKKYDYSDDIESKLETIFEEYKNVSVENIAKFMLLLEKLNYRVKTIMVNTSEDHYNTKGYYLIMKLLTSPTGIYCLKNKQEIKDIYKNCSHVFSSWKSYYYEKTKHIHEKIEPLTVYLGNVLYKK
jgi:hypothetical protein